MHCLVVYTVDIEGLQGFMFRRVHNKFHLGLFSIVYLILSFRSSIYYLVELETKDMMIIIFFYT